MTQTTEMNIKSQTINQVEITKEPAIKTGNEKFDNWVSKNGGLVLRSTTLLTGSSGGGKTSLMINLMKWVSAVKTSMYSREMRKDDVKEQTANVKFEHENAYIADKKTHPHFEDYMKELDVLKPKIIIVDSLQVIASEDYPELSEDKACDYVSSRLGTWVGDNDAVLILIGHVTKEGEFAGKNTLKHLVDAHIELVFDKKNNTRTISFSKNRKGLTGNMLYYTFEESGIELFTEDEWLIKSGENRNFGDAMMRSLNSYLNTLNKKHENYSMFKKEYQEKMKEISKIEYDKEHAFAALSLVYDLANKYSL